MIRIALAALVLAFAVSAFGDCAFKGFVYCDGVPIAGATVSVYLGDEFRCSVQTGSDGYYCVPDNTGTMCVEPFVEYILIATSSVGTCRPEQAEGIWNGHTATQIDFYLR